MVTPRPVMFRAGGTARPEAAYDAAILLAPVRGVSSRIFQNSSPT